MGELSNIIVTDLDKRLVEGFANVEIVDKQGDIVATEVMKRAMMDFMDKNGILMFGHKNKPIGKVIQWDIQNADDYGVKGVHIVASIYKDGELANEVWKLIQKKELEGFSIGGVLKDSETRTDGTHDVRILKDIELNEISVVGMPANQGAIIENMSVAKGLEYFQMPFADFKNWDACMEEQRKKYSEEVAQKVCGSLKAKYEKSQEDVKNMNKEIVDEVLEDLLKKAFPWDECHRKMMDKYHDDNTANKVCGDIKRKYGKSFKEAIESGFSEDVAKHIALKNTEDMEKQIFISNKNIKETGTSMVKKEEDENRSEEDEKREEKDEEEEEKKSLHLDKNKPLRATKKEEENEEEEEEDEEKADVDEGGEDIKELLAQILAELKSQKELKAGLGNTEKANYTGKSKEVPYEKPKEDSRNDDGQGVAITDSVNPNQQKTEDEQMRKGSVGKKAPIAKEAFGGVSDEAGVMNFNSGDKEYMKDVMDIAKGKAKAVIVNPKYEKIVYERLHPREVK